MRKNHLNYCIVLSILKFVPGTNIHGKRPFVRIFLSRPAEFGEDSMNNHAIIDDLLSSLPDKPVPVRSVLVGAHWIAVCSIHCGLATTIIGSKPHDHTTVVRDAGRLHTKSAQELAADALSENFLEASIGLAAINSLLEVNEQDAVEMTASEVLMKKGAGKNVAIVGHFPFISRLRREVGNLWVIEQHPTGDDNPAEAAADLISGQMRSPQVPLSITPGRPASSLQPKGAGPDPRAEHAPLTIAVRSWCYDHRRLAGR